MRGYTEFCEWQAKFAPESDLDEYGDLRPEVADRMWRDHWASAIDAARDAAKDGDD